MVYDPGCKQLRIDGSKLLEGCWTASIFPWGTLLLTNEQDELKVAFNQIGSPTYAGDKAWRFFDHRERPLRKNEGIDLDKLTYAGNLANLKNIEN